MMIKFAIMWLGIPNSSIVPFHDFQVYNIAVIGGSQADQKYKPLAIRVGNKLAEEKALVICGGMSGVMEWVSQGVSEAGGTVIGILPGWRADEGNRYLTYGIPTGIGYARNFLIIRASDSVIAIDGATGTLSEAAFALTEGKSVIALGDMHIDHIKIDDGRFIKAPDPEGAVRLAIEEAKRFRSSGQRHDQVG